MRPAADAAQLNTLLPADARAFAMPGRWRRSQPSRRTATRRSVYMRKVPAGMMRAPDQQAWLDAVRASEAFSSLRADTAASLWAVAQQLAWRASYESMTTRPTWAVVIRETGRSWSTVGRAIRRLRAAGLIGVVKTGRDGAHQPAKCDKGQADAAVYVLCVPSTVHPVDEHDTLTDLKSGEESHPPHARASEGPAEPLRGTLVAAAARPGAPVGLQLVPQEPSRPPDEPESPLEPSRPPDGRDLANDAKDGRRLDVARALQERLPVLRRISDRHVASLVREFVLAGWTTSELAVAVDRRPDGTAWPHSGEKGVGNVGAWLRFRLAAWRDDAGTVQMSPGRRAEAERIERRARQRADAERQALTVPAGPDSPGLAAVRAILSARRGPTGGVLGGVFTAVNCEFTAVNPRVGLDGAGGGRET